MMWLLVPRGGGFPACDDDDDDDVNNKLFLQEYDDVVVVDDDNVGVRRTNNYDYWLALLRTIRETHGKTTLQFQ